MIINTHTYEYLVAKKKLIYNVDRIFIYIYIDEYIVLIDTFTTQKHVQQLLLNLRLDASIDSLDQVRLKSVLWIHVDKMARPICIWIN